MPDDYIILRRQMVEESTELNKRVAELSKRIRSLDEAHEAASRKADAEAGRTNACNSSWNSEGRCSYCGSIGVAAAIQLLKTSGTTYSGADWKYGWPHKFYLNSNKFYNGHLADASEELFNEFSKLSEELFEVTWIKDEGKMKYRAVSGVQKSGTVGVVKIGDTARAE